MELKTAFKDRFKMGAAISRANLETPAHTRLLLDQYNSFTCENDMKPMYFLDSEANRSEPEKYNLEPKLQFDFAIPYLEFAKKNGIGMRGHTLVWHNQTPKWFFCEHYNEMYPMASRETIPVSSMPGMLLTKPLTTVISENHSGHRPSVTTLSSRLSNQHVSMLHPG